MSMSGKAMRALLAASISATGLIAGQAHAQQAGASEASEGLEAIVVTARKRTENLQNVSSSISALGVTDLAKRFDSDVRDFANSAPNVLIDDTQQGPGGVAAIYIRGIGVVTAAMIIGHVGNIDRFATAAAYATADAAADAAYAYVRSQVLAKCADIVRKHYPKSPNL